MSLKARLSKLKTSTVEVRGETIEVVEITAGQRESLIPMFKDAPVSAMRHVCAMCAMEDGSPVWTPEEAESLPSDVVDAVATEALRISGMDDASPND